MKCNHESFVWWYRGESKNNPLGSKVTSILKTHILPPMYRVSCVRHESEKSETTKSKWWIFKMVAMAREVSRASFVWRPFTCAQCHRAPFLSSSSCGLTTANIRFNLQTIHNNNSQNRTMKTEQMRKKSNMAVTALHDQKSSISGAPRTDLEQKRFWTRSGRLQKANDGLLPCLFLICDFNFSDIIVFQ